MPIDVTVPGNGGRAKRRGITVHRSTTLRSGECTLRRGIPVTTPARTLDDLCHVLSRREFAAALREAEFLHLPVGDRFGTDQTRSELERRLLALCRRHRLPQPEVNTHVGHYTVDFSWPAERLIVEVDGWAAHRTRSAFEEDRSRDVELKLRGYEVLRFTWRQVDSQPRRVAKTIRALLRR
jgi:very-short-patch-repair endonuclease